MPFNSYLIQIHKVKLPILSVSEYRHNLHHDSSDKTPIACGSNYQTKTIYEKVIKKISDS